MGHRVICAADFMEQPRCLLEARREQLYEEVPVSESWHEAYARGNTNTLRYRVYGDEYAQHRGVRGEEKTKWAND